MTNDEVRVKVALANLIDQIRRGVEFPDALWRVTQRTGINSDVLTKAYDEYCKGK